MTNHELLNVRVTGPASVPHCLTQRITEVTRAYRGAGRSGTLGTGFFLRLSAFSILPLLLSFLTQQTNRLLCGTLSVCTRVHMFWGCLKQQIYWLDTWPCARDHVKSFSGCFTQQIRWLDTGTPCARDLMLPPCGWAYLLKLGRQSFCGCEMQQMDLLLTWPCACDSL